MLQITRAGAELSGSESDLSRLRVEFARDHFSRLPRLVDPGLLDILRRQIDGSDFYERVHTEIGPNKEWSLRPSKPVDVLHLLFNGTPFLRRIQEITQCGAIGSFLGRVYRCVPGLEHKDAWHGDIDEHRLVALTLNLSPEPYVGGVLQMRDARTKNLLHEIPNLGFGDAVIFRLSPELEHRITEVEGTVPKTAFAGWFHSQPDFLTLLRTRVRPPAAAGN